jgi:hypothetical protein
MGAQLMHIGIPTVCEKHDQQVCFQSKPENLDEISFREFLGRIRVSNKNLIKKNVLPLYNR